MNLIKQFLSEEDGPTAVEYAVMLALIIAACIVSIGTVGQSLNNTWDQVIHAQIESAKNTP
ncbi:MAG: Flp family type IVb pilin [Planctomycetaceae bacterium]|jgi:pilus assembly protein Flp/PilA|nr:Flp family type IVb pilin [Planctomycetaceae bacterium]MDG2390993.1 Flp family type IVb pilin [Planctomycetaceae bacterium]